MRTTPSSPSPAALTRSHPQREGGLGRPPGISELIRDPVGGMGGTQKFVAGTPATTLSRTQLCTASGEGAAWAAVALDGPGQVQGTPIHITVAELLALQMARPDLILSATQGDAREIQEWSLSTESGVNYEHNQICINKERGRIKRKRREER